MRSSMPSSPRNLKAAAWGWRSAVQSWNRMVAVCGPRPTTDEVRHFISLCQPQSVKCLRQYDFKFLRACKSRIGALLVSVDFTIREAAIETTGMTKIHEKNS